MAKGRWPKINGVTLAVTHYVLDMEPEEATSCIHTATQVEQPTLKTFNPYFILYTSNAGTEEGAETEGMANQ